MAVITEEYQKLVLDDLSKNKGLYHIVKAGFLELRSIRNHPISKLHPNPEDEFCDPAIGPNYGIVSDYAASIRSAIEYEKTQIVEPLVVAKISNGDYLLLNGHHRWMAAHRVKLDKVPVEIVNPVSVETIIKQINNSARNKCVSFDLDEVLLNKDGKLRSSAPALINELHSCGFDVWVYTGQYISEKKIKKYFSKEHTTVDGIINCFKKKNKSSGSSLGDTFKNKYETLIHIDNALIVCTNTRTKEVSTFDITADESTWASVAINLIKENYEKQL